MSTETSRTANRRSGSKVRTALLDREDRDTLQAVQRLWYDVEVVERGCDLAGTDHGRRLLIEPVTRTGNPFVAWRGEQVVGAVVSLYAGRDELGDYPTWFPGDWSRGCSLTIRLVTDPAHRDREVAVALARATYRQGLRDGITHDFADTHVRALPFFHRLGYQRIGSPIDHPVFGQAFPMRLALRDHAHLAARRSPLLADLEQLSEERVLHEFAATA